MNRISAETIMQGEAASWEENDRVVLDIGDRQFVFTANEATVLGSGLIYVAGIAYRNQINNAEEKP